jgi:hypothetical protein
MQQLLATAASARLESLDLGCCGRGFTDASALALSAAPPGGLPALRRLALQGAYNLSDGALLALLERAPGLLRLAVPQASKFDGTLVSRLPALLPGLQELDLAGEAGGSRGGRVSRGRRMGNKCGEAGDLPGRRACGWSRAVAVLGGMAVGMFVATGFGWWKREGWLG